MNRGFLVLAGLVLHTAAIVVLVILLTGVRSRVADVETQRVADKAASRASFIGEKKGTIQSTFTACLRSIEVNAQLNAFVIGAETVANVILANSERMHKVTPKDSPTYKTQIVNIRNLRAAISIGSGFRLPVPTAEICNANRKEALKKLRAMIAARDKAQAG